MFDEGKQDVSFVDAFMSLVSMGISIVKRDKVEFTFKLER